MEPEIVCSVDDNKYIVKEWYWIDDDFYIETKCGKIITLPNAYISKLSYNFEGQTECNEDITMVGNNKEW